ncbi:antibiotic biosynthesis monooxygenase (ABM) superfamily enzyme [Rhodococcus sp. PvR044]|jgi:antibiotic biosynthesis monooxygenase (ABM) superfamily enzyme
MNLEVLLTTTNSAPRRWKVWLLTVCGIYPILAVLGAVLTPLMDGAPMPVRLAVSVSFAVASMVWVINPFTARYLSGWLCR